MSRSISDVLPVWYTPLNMTLSGLSIVASLAAIVLLLLPAANAYFAKPTSPASGQLWPQPGYPQQPQQGYPPQQGHPQSPPPGYPSQQPPGQPW